MNEHNYNELRELTARLYGAAAAESVSEDILSGDQLLASCTAPEPDARIVSHIKARMASRLSRRAKTRRRAYESVAAAAAIAIIALIGLFGRGPAGAPSVAHAGLIPTAVWESDNLAADDLEIIYFNAEIEHIEAQLRTLESGDAETPDDRLNNMEMELMQIDTEFWKG
jgi:hypothetical protein